MLGSLSVYRRVLNDKIFNPRRDLVTGDQLKLPVLGHAMAGTMAGWTVSFVAAPVEHIKARLQVQYAADKSKRLYKGPVDCLKKIVTHSPPPRIVTFSDTLTVPRPWRTWRLPWPLLDPSIPHILLLLVGHLRCVHPSLQNSHQPLHARHKLLGRRSQRSDILDHVLSVGCGKTTHHDRPTRARAQVFSLAGRSKSNLEGKWLEGLLERFRAVFSEGVSCKRDGFGCI